MRRLSRPPALLLPLAPPAPPPRRRSPRRRRVRRRAGRAAGRAADGGKSGLGAPMSGRWARQGQLMKMGADMAVEEINSQGGIKALGGARIWVRGAAACDGGEKAVSAAQRVLTREKISAGIGSWLSSFTLGVTEVAERLPGARGDPPYAHSSHR